MLLITLDNELAQCDDTAMLFDLADLWDDLAVGHRCDHYGYRKQGFCAGAM